MTARKWKYVFLFTVGFLIGNVDRPVGVVHNRSWQDVKPTQPSEKVIPLVTPFRLPTNQPPPPSVPPTAPPLAFSEPTDPMSRVLNNTLIIIPLNMGYLEFGLNLLCSLRKLEITNYIFLAMDESVFDILLAKRIPVYMDKALPFVMSEAGMFGEEKFHRLLCLKLLPVINLLKKGVNVLFTDADIVWLRDPTPFLRWDLDLTISIGGCQAYLPDNLELSLSDDVSMCTGFYFVQAKISMIDMFSRTHQACMSGHLPDQKWQGAQVDDQTAMNSVVDDDQVFGSFSGAQKYHYGFFDGCRFANGCVYFKHVCKGMEGYNEEVIVHANFLVGKKEKIHNLNRTGLWYETCISNM